MLRQLNGESPYPPKPAYPTFGWVGWATRQTLLREYAGEFPGAVAAGSAKVCACGVGWGLDRVQTLAGSLASRAFFPMVDTA